jgi:hypothetical protein
MLPVFLFITQSPDYPILTPFHTFDLTTDPTHELRGNNSHVFFDDKTAILIVIHSGNLISFYNLKTKKIEGQYSLSLHNPNGVTRQGNNLTFYDTQSPFPKTQRIFDLESRSEKFIPTSGFVWKNYQKLLPESIDGRTLISKFPFGYDRALAHERTVEDKKAFLTLRQISDQKLLAEVNIDPSLDPANFKVSDDQQILFVRTGNFRDTLIYRLPTLKRLGIFRNHGGSISTDPHALWGINHGSYANIHRIWQGKPIIANLRTFNHYLLGKEDIQGADVSPKLGLAATILNHRVSLYYLPK